MGWEMRFSQKKNRQLVNKPVENYLLLLFILVALQKTRSKGPLANDPIARSIAGYLIKNVPDYKHMLNVKTK